MVPPSNDNKTTYTLSLGWLLNPVVNIWSFWLLLMTRVQTPGKIYKKCLAFFVVQQKLSFVTLAVKTKLVVLQKVFEQQNNSKVLSTSQL